MGGQFMIMISEEKWAKLPQIDDRLTEKYGPEGSPSRKEFQAMVFFRVATKSGGTVRAIISESMAGVRICFTPSTIILQNSIMG